MRNLRRVYKTKSEFELDLCNGKLYEGFVIGEGYAYVHNVYQMPGNLNGFGHFTDNYPEHNRYQGFYVQKIETTSEMIRLSLQSQTLEDFVEIKIQKGDTLCGLAQELGVTVDDLIKWNNIADRNTIIAGQMLKIDVNKAKNGSKFKTLLVSPLLSYLESKPEKDDDGKQTRNFIFLDDLRVPMSFVGYSSIFPTTIGGLKYTPNARFTNIGGFWYGAKGQFYNMSQSSQSSGRGWVFRAGSAKIAKNVSVFKNLRVMGNTFGGLSTSFSAISFLADPNWEDGLDTVGGISGFIYWPVASTYFGGKLFFKGMLNYTETMMENGFVPGRDDLIIWK